MKRILIALAMAAAPLSAAMLAPVAHAEEIAGMDGRWEGALSIEGTSLRLVLRVSTADGNTTAILNSPDQTDMDIPVSDVRRDGERIIFDVAIVQGRFAAALSEDGQKLSGEWSQLGNALPLEMTRQ